MRYPILLCFFEIVLAVWTPLRFRFFISFPCLIALAGAVHTISTRSGESRYPCLIPSKRGKLSVFTEYNVSWKFFINALYCVKVLSIWS